LRPSPPPSPFHIESIPRSHRYRLTLSGLRIAMFFWRTNARLPRPKLAEIMPDGPPTDSRGTRSL